ncbi:MAG: dipeptide/oligopeptide/nickel ABC transporter ATP-binding protein [Eubacteriales bacterium]|nr:dipeptide/oligopeptide/nickel ABC transporter ATP-binding protein [Eubacteriales bacterium]
MERLLEVRELKKTFYKEKKPFVAVDRISFHVDRGECVGLVGESGCGKSTTAGLITRLLDPDAGSILLDGEEILDWKPKDCKKLYRKVQMIFQTPQDSFDPRRTLGDGILESLQNQGMKRRAAEKRMYELLEMVDLGREFAKRLPHEVSGGQCQRAAIARALAPNPELLICDEATSALDVTVQAQIAGLLKKLQRERGLSLLLICHDLALVQHLCSRMLVMYGGAIVEEGAPDQVIQNPAEEYTKLLVESAF